MSTARREPAPEESADEYPTFDLECAYDDESEPARLTVFSTRSEDDLATAWLSVGVDDAVPLEDVQ